VKIQWVGDNLPAIQKALASYGTVEISDASRCVLSIHAQETHGGGFVAGSAIQVFLGETIEVRRYGGKEVHTDSVGIHRLPNAGNPEQVTWTGENAKSVAAFVLAHDVRIESFGAALKLKTRDVDGFVLLRRGDRLLKNGGCLFMSRAGQDHRA
jgi:hypothetical protein